MTKMLLFITFIMCHFIWLLEDGTYLGHSVWGSSVGESNSLFPTNITIFVIEQQRTWVRPGVFLSTMGRVTVCTTLFLSVSLTILAIGHWFCFFNSTISPTVKFGVCFFHFWLGCRLWGTLFSTCSKILQQYVEHDAIVFWNIGLVD